MVEARWNGSRVACSDDIVVVEGNNYFPLESLDASLLRSSSTTSICPWKGTAHYYSLHVEGTDNVDAAWYYPNPKPEAEAIRNRVAFWKGVTVS